MEDFPGKYGMVGESEVMKKLFEEIELLAPTDNNIFIRGMRGTGKELVAKAIHNKSPRKDKPFIPINCAAIQPTLLESELFGHEKGAFTGAYKEKEGLFEIANYGTVYLDEIADMSTEIQPKILRAIENKDFRRVGGTRYLQVDVRFLASTSKDVEDLINKEKFRNDLYDRLNSLCIFVPSLNERKGDIPLLVEYFIKENEKRGIKCDGISEEVLDTLIEYDWQGNVRQLMAAVDWLTAHSKSCKISPELVGQYEKIKQKTQSSIRESSRNQILANVLRDVRDKVEHLINDEIYRLSIFEKEFGMIKEQYGNVLGMIRKIEGSQKETYHILEQVKKYITDENRNPEKNFMEDIRANFTKKDFEPYRKNEHKNETTDYKDLHRPFRIYQIARLSGIPIFTLRNAVSREKKKNPAERRLKFVLSEEDDKIRMTIPDLIEYFKSTGTFRYVTKLQNIMKCGAGDNFQNRNDFSLNPEKASQKQKYISKECEETSLNKATSHYRDPNHMTPGEREFQKESEGILKGLFADGPLMDGKKLSGRLKEQKVDYSDFSQKILSFPPYFIERIVEDNPGNLYKAIKEGKINYVNENGRRSLNVQKVIDYYIKEGMKKKASKLESFNKSIAGKVPIRKVHNIFEVPSGSIYYITKKLKTEDIYGVNFVPLAKVASYLDNMKSENRKKYASCIRNIRNYLKTIGLE